MGIARFSVKAKLGEKFFAEFGVDVGAGDVRISPFEELISQNLLAFAGIADCPPFYSISAEQHFAEKIHAYTLPRGRRTNTRVKDLIDLVLLVQTERIRQMEVLDALQRIFDRRGTHPLPTTLPPPPVSWQVSFARYSAECGLKMDLMDGYKKVRDYYDKLTK